MMVRRPLIFALFAAAACTPPASLPLPDTERGPAIPPRVAASFPEGWRFPAGGEGVVARNAMVVSNDSLASAAGVEILQQGGNAVDAAVAVGYALAVTHPEAGNLGGGGYMVIRMADGRAAAIDYRETAPGKATRDMYVGKDGKLTDKSLVGHLASGVPGAVMGMSEALTRYGTMTLEQVIAPALRLADFGFVVDRHLAASVRSDSALIARFAGAPTFLPDGTPISAGTRLKQPELARTLRLLSREGPGVFYHGDIGDLLVEEMRRGGGIITKEDLADYRAEWRTPIQSSYRGYTLLTMPPSSSGGVTITETLNILETYEALDRFGSASFLHRLASAYQRAFIDRNARLADPAFTPVPVELLTSKSYARELRATIDEGRATPTGELTRELREGTHTTHYSVVDREGNAVSTTTTINSLYGSGVYIPGAGFFMNNEMDDFAAQPGKPNQFGLVQGEANAIAPRKRMLSAMSPTIVLDPAGQVLLVVGGRGGPRIITATSQVILNVIEHDMTLYDAVAAPRIHHQALPDSVRYERDGLFAETAERLAAMGHHLYVGGPIGSVTALMRIRGGWEGIVDPRSYGGAVGF